MTEDITTAHGRRATTETRNGRVRDRFERRNGKGGLLISGSPGRNRRALVISLVVVVSVIAIPVGGLAGPAAAVGDETRTVSGWEGFPDPARSAVSPDDWEGTSTDGLKVDRAGTSVDARDVTDGSDRLSPPGTKTRQEDGTAIGSCMEIAEPGKYVLTGDIEPENETDLALDSEEYPDNACIAINASGVSLDGQGHTINGSLVNQDGNDRFRGVRIENLSDSAGIDEKSEISATVTNTTLVGWYRGVAASVASSPTVADNTITSDYPGRERAIEIIHADGATVERNTIDVGWAGIYVDDSSQVTVQDNTVTNASHASIYSNSNETAILGNVITRYPSIFHTNTPHGGVFLQGAPHATIEDNHFVDERGSSGGFDRTAIVTRPSPSGPSDDLVIKNNAIDGDEGQIKIGRPTLTRGDVNVGPAGVVIRNNTAAVDTGSISFYGESTAIDVVDNDLAGTRLYFSSHTNDILIENNTITDASTGISVNGDRATIVDNDLAGNRDGLSIGGSNFSTIHHNTITESDEIGLVVSGPNPETVIADNSITHGAGVGVQIEERTGAPWSGAILRDNDITHNADVGITYDWGGVAPDPETDFKPVIRANNISYNGEEGIDDGGTNNATYEDNRIVGNEREGIYIIGYAENSTIEGNTISDNGDVGIRLGRNGGSAENVAVVDNHLVNNTDHAIVVETSPGVVVENNTMAEHDVDLLLDPVSGTEVYDNTFGTGLDFQTEDDGQYDHHIEGNEFHDGSALLSVRGIEDPQLPDEAGQVVVVATDGVTAGDVDIEGPRPPIGLLVAGSDDTTVENVSVTGSSSAGVKVVDSTDVRLENATVSAVEGPAFDDGVGVLITASEVVTVRGSEVSDVGAAGIEVDTGAEISLLSNDVSTTGAEGIIVSDSPGTTVAETTIAGTADKGIDVSDSSASTLTRNVVTGAGSNDHEATGIDVTESQEVDIVENDVSGSHGVGIGLRQSENATIRANDVSNNQLGIDLGGNFGLAAGTTLLDNVVWSNTEGGIEATARQEVRLVENNTISENEGDGFFIDGGDDVAIRENTFEDNADAGLATTDLENVTIVGNTFDGNADGISDESSDDVSIADNTIHSQGDSGIYLDWTRDFEIRNNTVSYHHPTSTFGIARGIRAEVAAGDSGRIVANQIEMNDYGVQLAAQDFSDDLIGSDVEIRDNNFSGNANGVAVYDEADQLSITDNSFESNYELAVGYSVDEPSHALNATRNWWGNQNGPSGDVADPETGAVADGEGDAVGANVAFDPWLSDESGVQPPTASFAYDPNEPSVGQEVTFDAAESVSPSGAIHEFQWDFTGDGTIDETVSQPETTYTFDSAGDFDVTLTVEDENGETDSTTLTVTIVDGSGGTEDEAPPIVAIEVDRTDRISTHQPVEITATSSDANPNQTTVEITNTSTDDEERRWDVTDVVADGSATVVWNATDGHGDPVETGQYTITVRSDDGAGNVNTTDESVAVDTTDPTVDLSAINSTADATGAPAGRTIRTNGTLSLAATSGGTPGDADSVTAVLVSQSTNFEYEIDLEPDGAEWTAAAELDRNVIPDDGMYDLNVTAIDPAGNENETRADVTVELDRAAPDLGATVSHLDDDTGAVNVTASEPLDGAPTIEIDRPDDTTETIDVDGDGNRWNATFELADEGEYDATITGADRADNAGTDTASATIEGVSTENNSAIVLNEESGTLVNFTTTDEVEDTFVSVSVSDVPPGELDPALAGVSFLTSNLDENLYANLSHADVYVPVDEDAPGDSGNVSIYYFNESKDEAEWEAQPTDVLADDEITLHEDVDLEDRYWTATVERFSTYGPAVRDDTAPSIDGASPTGELDTDTERTTVRFEYSDDQSGIDASSVVLRFDGEDVSNDDVTSITSGYAEYEAADLASGEDYEVEVTVEDQAGNAATDVLDFEVADGDDGDGGDSTGSSSRSSTSRSSSDDGDSASNVEVPPDVEAVQQDVAEVEVDEEAGRARVEFAENSAVERIEFEDSDVVGEVSVAELSVEPSETGEAPGATVSVAQIEVPEGTEDTPAIVRTRVDGERVAELDADPSDLRVSRFADGEWQVLETRVVEDTTNALILEAETPGFSYFAVSAVSEPEAVITLDPAAVAPGDEIELSAGESTDRYGEIVAYEWTITDRRVEGASASVTLDEQGEYTVELAVTNDAGETATATETVLVQREETPAPASPSAAPTRTESPGGQPGFGLGTALVAITIAGLYVHRRRR